MEAWKNRALTPLGEAEHVQGTKNRGLDGLDRVVLIMDGRSGTGKIEDPVDLRQEGLSDVVADEFEGRIADEMFDVSAMAGEVVVEADDLVARVDQPITQMRPEEPRSPGHQNSFSHD